MTNTKATLLAFSQPASRIHTGELGVRGLDSVQELVAYCARVSNPTNQMNKESTPKLLDYLIKHSHWSPFEMASATIEIETTRDIARQLLRHRSFSFQEFSQRYAEVTDLGKGEDWAVIREARLQDPKNRQNSVETDDIELKMWWDAQQKFLIHHTTSIYDQAIKRGIAKEQARVILPEGITKSRLYVHGTIRSWIHYIDLRSKNGTQLEHVEIALAVAKAISKIYPKALEFIGEENG
jgi:thymidylate synthase (FAD)